MKKSKLSFACGALALGLSLQPGTSWSSRAYTAALSGTITAQPSSSSGTLEIDRKVYHVKANTAAAKLLSSLYVGEVIDVILDGPPNGVSKEVISIQKHAGS
jgi:hypothetical protein